MSFGFAADSSPLLPQAALRTNVLWSVWSCLVTNFKPLNQTVRSLTWILFLRVLSNTDVFFYVISTDITGKGITICSTCCCHLSVRDTFLMFIYTEFFFARTNTLAVLDYRGTMSYGENEYLEKSFFFWGNKACMISLVTFIFTHG